MLWRRDSLLVLPLSGKVAYPAVDHLVLGDNLELQSRLIVSDATYAEQGNVPTCSLIESSLRLRMSEKALHSPWIWSTSSQSCGKE